MQPLGDNKGDYFIRSDDVDLEQNNAIEKQNGIAPFSTDETLQRINDVHSTKAVPIDTKIRKDWWRTLSLYLF